jgi:hypothetical protein
MTSQNWVSLLNPDSIQASGAGAALATATTATLSPVTGSGADVAQVNPAGQYQGWKAGLNIRWTARGFITSTTSATSVAFMVAARLNNTGSTWVILATHAMTLSTGTTAITGVPWMGHGLIRCTAIATSGNTVSSEGEINISANPATAQTLNTASAGVNLYMPSASGEQVAVVDTTQLQGISFRASSSVAGPTIQLTQWLPEMMN